MMEVISGGALNLIQDMGRNGYMNQGISRGGAMDMLALSLANVLVGNQPDTAAIEINIFPFRVKFEEDVWFACTGGNSAIMLDDESVSVWWRKQAKAGQTLVIERPRQGMRAYLAVRSGINVPPVLGSASTDLKCEIGGLSGRALKRGDKLTAREIHLWKRASLGIIPAPVPDFWRELSARTVTVKVLPAAEFSEFTAEALENFTRTAYAVTPQSSRLGYRLSGAALLKSRDLELLSHGIVPGTIQVPPDGQPIVQLADANTCGGYPKIATIIESELWKVAQCPPGCQLRFELVSIDAALHHLHEFHSQQTLLIHNLHLYS